MSRRSASERLHAAREAATVRRLELDGVSAERAAALVATWEAQAARDGLERGSAYWTAAWEWIAEERLRRRMP